jgi:hypothetical protein
VASAVAFLISGDPLAGCPSLAPCPLSLVPLSLRTPHLALRTLGYPGLPILNSIILLLTPRGGVLTHVDRSAQ